MNPTVTTVTQRWRDGRDRYRPAGEPIATRLYEVAALSSDTTARRFVAQHHYSRSYPAARRRFGLYHRGALCGVAVFSVPAQPACLACLPGTADAGLCLGRFVLLDYVPANGETWFLARSFDLLRREGFAGVVSFSDPLPRTRGDGVVVMPGHVGTIYQAFNAVYLGRSKPSRLRLFGDGTILDARALAKARNGERGRRYVVDLLTRHGADAPSSEPLCEWATRWADRLTRSVRHPGNHRYAWTLQKRDRRHLPASMPYPKVRHAAA